MASVVAWVGNDPSVPKVLNLQTIQKDTDQPLHMIKTGPAISHTHTGSGIAVFRYVLVLYLTPSKAHYSRYQVRCIFRFVAQIMCILK